MSFELVQSELIYSGRAFNIRKDLVRLPGGKTHYFDIVDHRPAVTIIPVDKSRNICFIRQYRHATGRELIELPAGVLEPDEEPFTGAQRELREEIGMAPQNLSLIGEFYLAPGYSTERMYVFLGEGLYADSLPQDEDEILSVQLIPIAEAYRMIPRNQIEDAKSLSALLLALPHFFRNGDLKFSTLDQSLYS